VGDHYVNLISRKKVYDVLGNPVYRFDVSGILKDYFGYSYSNPGLPVAAGYNRECELTLGIEIANLYTGSASFEQSDELSGSSVVITVVNAALRHSDFHAFTSGQKHFTMGDYTFYHGSHIDALFLTHKPPVSYTSLKYSESLYLLADYANAVHFTFRDTAGVVTGTAIQQLNPVGDFGGGVYFGVHQRIPVGPRNINNTSSWFYNTGVPSVLGSTASYEVRAGRLTPFGGGSFGFTYFNAGMRKFVLRDHCWNHFRIHFMGHLGGIDTATMMLDGIKVTAKSNRYERAPVFPYKRVDWGAQRLSTDRTDTFNLQAEHHDMFGIADSMWLSQLLSAPLCLVQFDDDANFITATVSDGSFPVFLDDPDQRPAEIEITIANKTPIQRL
jgi:hypothetical protein